MTSVQNHLTATRLGGAEGVLTDDQVRAFVREQLDGVAVDGRFVPKSRR